MGKSNKKAKNADLKLANKLIVPCGESVRAFLVGYATGEISDEAGCYLISSTTDASHEAIVCHGKPRVGRPPAWWVGRI